MAITFLIKGSSKNPYKVTFQKNEGHVYAGCDCQSRKGGMACKHIFNILDGDVTNMIEGDKNDIKDVLQLCEGTRFNELFIEYKSGLKVFNSKYLTELKKAMVTKPLT
jgi:hypothetical protein